MSLNYKDMLDQEKKLAESALEEQLKTGEQAFCRRFLGDKSLCLTCRFCFFALTEPVQRLRAKLEPEMEKIVVASFLTQMQKGAFFQTWSKGRLKKGKANGSCFCNVEANGPKVHDHLCINNPRHLSLLETEPQDASLV